MIIPFKIVKNYAETLGYKSDIENFISEINDLEGDTFGEKLKNYYKYNAGIITDIEGLTIKLSKNDPDLEPDGWDPEAIHSIAKAATNIDTFDIIIIHNEDVFEITDPEDYKNLLLYFLYHELTHIIRLNKGCNDKYYEGAISKEYLLSEGELNAFMVQLVSGLFGDVVLDIYNIFFDQYTKKEIAYIQDTLNKVKAD